MKTRISILPTWRGVTALLLGLMVHDNLIATSSGQERSLASAGGRAPTPLSGSQSGTLALANSPYVATADLYVSPGQTLTIEPGVVVQFQNLDTALVVDGTLMARGTAAAPILFTSDDAQKAPGQWEAIVFRGSNTNSILENCTVEYGAASGVSDESIRLEGASPTLRNCTVRQSRRHGLTLLASDPLIENCQFLSNGSGNTNAFALAMRTDSLPRLRNSTATGNGRDAIGVFDFNLGRNGTWVKDNLPYTLLNDVYVNGGKTFTLEPGVVLQFQNLDTALVVDGTLIARGTAAAPILFTSDEVQKAPGQWEAVIFRGPNTNSILEHCLVEYGAALRVSDESVRLEGASPTLRNCTVRQSRMHGLTLLSSDPLIENCQFLSNGSTNATAFAVMMRTDSLPRLKGNTAQGNVHDAIGVFDFNFGRNGTWVNDSLPYTLLNDVFVNEGKTFTLEPGVVLQFQNPDTALVIDGTLTAQGTVQAPIRFTSDEVLKAPGQWEAIIFRSTATNSILEHCLVEYAAAAGVSDESVRFENATATIRNCTIRNSRLHGLTFYASSPVVEDCQFLNNGFTNVNAFAMALRTDSWPRLANNTGTGNGNDAIRVFDYHVSRSGIWLRDNLPYTLANDVYIDAGATLTLEPGVVLQFQYPDTALVVDGTLTARGTAAKPILFTSEEVQKASGQWEAIIFRATNLNSILENCILEYGAAAGISDEIVRFENATATIRNCTIRNSRKDGMRFQFSDPLIENCQLVSNGATNSGFAMAMRIDSLPRLKNNLAVGNGRDAIGVFDYNFGRMGTWGKDNLPYTLLNDVYVNAGKALTIEPGVTVQFQDPNVGLFVDGTLTARGTPSAPITFTSEAKQKKTGQWKALIFRAPDANSILENCNVGFGGANAEGNIALYSASPRINNCAIRNSVSDAIHCNASASAITACRIVNSGRDGVRTVNGASPVVNNSTISGHGEFGVRNFDTTRIINARSNFWGDPSGPLDSSNVDGRGQTNPNGKGAKVSEYVDWSSPLQTDPIASTPPQKVEIAPASLDFRGVVIGQSKELLLAVRNAGGLDLTVTSVTSDNPRFQVASPATPFTVAAGLQQVVRITFSAAATTTVTGTLTISSDDPSQPSVNVPLNASGAVADECLPPPSGLIGWWPGDGSFLNLVATNHGLPLGGVSFASGKVGRAFNFANDSDRMTVPHDPLLDVQAPGFTVEFWMRGIKNQPQGMYLVVDKSHGWADSTGWMFQGYSDSGKIAFAIGPGGGGIVNFPSVTSTTDVLDGMFHHLAGTWDGSTTRLYVDGELQGQTALSAPANNTRPVNLGYSWGGGSPNRFFRGQVDELSIYRRALTTNEIQAIFEADSAGKCKQAGPGGLIAYLPFNGNANDESGSGHNGIVNGATLTTDRFGQPNRAYQFDGKTQFIELADSKELNFSTGGFTLSAWVAYTESGWAGHVIAKHFSYVGADNGYFLDVGSNAVAFFMNSMMWLGTTETYNDGKWHHLVGVYDGATMFLYVDNVLKGSQVRGSPKANDMSITIGKATDAGYFSGKIDDVRIYGRALSLAEVTTLYDDESKPKETTGSLAAYLPFNGNANDESGNGHIGIVNGATLTPDRFGKANRAYQFDGTTQFISLAGTTNLNFTSGGFTLSAWVSYDNVPSEGIVVGKHYGGYWNGFFVQIKGNAPAFFLNGEPRLVSADTANDSKWHHLVGVYDGTTQFLYVDGVLKGTRAMPYTVPNAASIEIGRVTSSSYFKGKIDDVRVYSRPLSSAEVTALNASESALGCLPPPTGLVGWWPADDNADDLQGTRQGALRNGAAFAAGQVGRAFNFDGADDYVDLGGWNLGRRWTIEAWVKPAATPSGRRNIAGGLNEYRDWAINLHDGQFGVAIRTPGGGAESVRSGVQPTIGNWYHVVGTCDGAIARIYVNGELKNSGAVDANYTGTATGFWIGGEVCCGGNNFPGLVDEVSIFGRPLSASEIRSIFETGSAGKCKPAIVAPGEVVKWTGNGHSYQAVLVGAAGIRWADARAAAERAGGHLATISSDDENAFVFSLVKSTPDFWYLDGRDGIGPWLGGFQPAGSREPDGGWTWVTAESMTYTHWSSGEPNNWGGAEDYLQFHGSGLLIASTWNDLPGDRPVRGYIVEFETTVTPGDCASVPVGLIGWWPGNGSFLNQVATNHGVPQGGVSFASGKVDRAFSFANDSDRITVPHDPLFDVQAPGFTVELWMRGTKNQPHDHYLVVDKSHGWVDSTGWFFQGFSSSGRIAFAIGVGGSGDRNYPEVTSTTDVLDGVFHHLAGTWDGTATRLYVDGVLQGQTPLSTPANNTRPVNLGYSWGGGSPNRFFRGQLDELSIYRRALATNEIQNIFAAGSAGKCGQTPPPTLLTLTVVRADNQIVISWPASTGRVVIQRTDSLLPPVQWNPLNTVPVVISGQSTVTIPTASMANATAFFRAVVEGAPLTPSGLVADPALNGDANDDRRR